MIKSHIPFLLIFFTLVAANATKTLAQRDTTKLNQEVEVVKAYRPSISNANKINLLPVIDDTTRFTPEFNYQINSQPVTSGFTVPTISAAEISGKQQKDTGYGLLRLGLGTYSTPYGEFFFNNPKSKNTTFGVHFKHLSSQGKIKLKGDNSVEAPYSHNLGEIFGSYIFPGATLSAKLSYNRDMVKFYGYPDTIPADINLVSYPYYFDQKQRFQKVLFNVGLKSEDGAKNDLRYSAGFHFQYFDALTTQKEKSGGIFANFDYNFGNFRGMVETSFDHFNTENIREVFFTDGLTTKQRTWLKINPSVLLEGDNWKAQGGLNFYSVFEKNGGNTAKMYPKIKLEFTPVEDIMTVYAGLDGYMKNNHFSAIADENPWADPRNDVDFTDFQYVINGGLKGKIASQIAYNFGIKYSSANGQYFYVMDIFAPYVYGPSSYIPRKDIYNNAFAIEYDNAIILDVSGELSYSKGDQLFVLLSAHLFDYSLEHLDVASHMPNYTLTATSKYRITERVTAFTDLQLIGDRKVVMQYVYPPESSLSPPAPFTTKIDPVFNLNLGADYQLMNKVKIFGRADNLLDQRYDRWYGYTSQGVRLMVGASLEF